MESAEQKFCRSSEISSEKRSKTCVPMLFGNRTMPWFLEDWQFLALNSIVDDSSLCCFLGKERGVHVLLPVSWLCTIFSSFTWGKGWGRQRLIAAWVVTWRVKVEWRTSVHTVLRLLKDMEHGGVFWNVLLYQEPRSFFSFPVFSFLRNVLLVVRVFY